MTAKTNGVSPDDAINPEKALVPAVQKVNEMRVRKGFWPKMRRTAARIPFALYTLGYRKVPADSLLAAATAPFLRWEDSHGRRAARPEG